MLRKLMITIVSLFLVFCTVMIVKQNICYPQPIREVHNVQESFSIGPIDLKVNSVETCSVEELVKRYDFHLAEEGIDASANVQVILVEVNIHNTSDSEEIVDTTAMEISSKNVMNCYEYTSYVRINEGIGTQPALEPNQEITILLPYIEYGTTYGVKEGDLMDILPMQVTFRLYPYKISVHLNDLW